MNDKPIYVSFATPKLEKDFEKLKKYLKSKPDKYDIDNRRIYILT